MRTLRLKITDLLDADGQPTTGSCLIHKWVTGQLRITEAELRAIQERLDKVAGSSNLQPSHG